MEQSTLFLLVNLLLTLIILLISAKRNLTGAPSSIVIVMAFYALGGFTLLLIHRSVWAEAARYLFQLNVTMTDQERRALEWALATDASIQSSLLFGLSGGSLLSSIVYFITNSAKRDSSIIRRILGKYADFDRTDPIDFKALLAFCTVFSSCLLIFLWASIVYDKGLLTSWVDIGLLIIFSFVLSEWINWNLVFNKGIPKLSDEKIELILLELRHREFLQIIHDLIYISLFIGAGLFISVIIPGAIRPSIMQLSPFYDVAVTVQFILAIYLAAGFFGFFMQFWLELARVEKYLKEIDNRREKTEKHLNTEDQSP